MIVRSSIRTLFLIAVLAFTVPLPLRAAEEPYDVNVIISLTGQLAFIGQTIKNVYTAMETAMNKRGGINGRPLHFVYYDDQTNPQQAVQLANTVIAKNVPYFLGPTSAAGCSAVVPLVQNGPIQYCLSSAVSAPKGGYTFAISTTTGDYIHAFVRYMHDRGWLRIARLTTTDASGEEANAAFAAAIANTPGMTVVADEKYGVSDQSVSAQMTRILAAHPQAIVMWMSGTPFGTAIRAYQDLGGTVPVFMSNANMSVLEFKQFANLLPPNLYSVSTPDVARAVKSPGSRAPLKFYVAALAAAGIPIDHITGVAWDATIIMLDAVRKLGFSATAPQLHAYLEHLSNYPGISGTYDFTDGDIHGIGLDDLLIMHYDASTGNWLTVSKMGGQPIR